MYDFYYVRQRPRDHGRHGGPRARARRGASKDCAEGRGKSTMAAIISKSARQMQCRRLFFFYHALLKSWQEKQCLETEKNIKCVLYKRK